MSVEQRIRRCETDSEPSVDHARSVCSVYGVRLALLGAALIGNFCGCGSVHRRMMIRSDPPGALVLVEGEEKGYTPMAMDFTYYGTREFTLIKDGYETLTVIQKVKTPWYQIVPIDFFSDNLLPFKVTNRHELSYPLKRQVTVPEGELLDRANALRSETQIGP